MVQRAQESPPFEAHSSVCRKPKLLRATIKVEPIRNRRIKVCEHCLNLLPEALQAQIYAPDPLSKWMLFAKIRDALVARGPSVVILDNIHLSDSGTIELMSYLILKYPLRKTRPDSFFIGTHTDVDTTEIDGILTGQSTNVEPTQILLNPLSKAAVEEWLLHLCEYDERAPISPAEYMKKARVTLH